mmetsp:Transcript_1126/g.1435  ORF Transcript_1126/g.1435 Transcript_1126/m.1435 type:complete len:186 (+) Transcript_1126:1229-1786(+)
MGASRIVSVLEGEGSPSAETQIAHRRASRAGLGFNLTLGVVNAPAPQKRPSTGAPALFSGVDSMRESIEEGNEDEEEEEEEEEKSGKGEEKQVIQGGETKRGESEVRDDSAHKLLDVEDTSSPMGSSLDGFASTPKTPEPEKEDIMSGLSSGLSSMNMKLPEISMVPMSLSMPWGETTTETHTAL